MLGRTNVFTATGISFLSLMRPFAGPYFFQYLPSNQNLFSLRLSSTISRENEEELFSPTENYTTTEEGRANAPADENPGTNTLLTDDFLHFHNQLSETTGHIRAITRDLEQRYEGLILYVLSNPQAGLTDSDPVIRAISLHYLVLDEIYKGLKYVIDAQQEFINTPIIWREMIAKGTLIKFKDLLHSTPNDIGIAFELPVHDLTYQYAIDPELLKRIEYYTLPQAQLTTADNGEDDNTPLTERDNDIQISACAEEDEFFLTGHLPEPHDNNM